MKHSKSPRDFGCPGCSLLKANLDAITRGKRAGSRFTIAPYSTKQLTLSIHYVRLYTSQSPGLAIIVLLLQTLLTWLDANWVHKARRKQYERSLELVVFAADKMITISTKEVKIIE